MTSKIKNLSEGQHSSETDSSGPIQQDDKLFALPRKSKDFTFDAETAVVFDDMVSRSVPFYVEIQRMVCELARDFAVPGTNLYDIGCSTGTTLLSLDKLLDPSIRLVGIDNSEEMLNKFNEKIKKENTKRDIALIESDINNNQNFGNGSVFISLLTLQFVRPLNRERLIKDIFNGCCDNGCLILVEKVTGSSTKLNRLFIEHYYDFKRGSGYSDLEISQKREALENVLIPYHQEENQALLMNAGFTHVEEFFRWYNFAGIIALK